MSLETEIYSLLSGTTVITSLVNTRIYPVKAPQNAIYPHLIYTRISGGQANTLDGYADFENPRIQIDTYSTGYLECKNLSSSVHSVMNGATAFKSILVSDGDLYEDEVDAYRVTMDFSCMNRT